MRTHFSADTWHVCWGPSDVTARKAGGTLAEAPPGELSPGQRCSFSWPVLPVGERLFTWRAVGARPAFGHSTPYETRLSLSLSPIQRPFISHLSISLCCCSAAVYSEHSNKWLNDYKMAAKLDPTGLY